jgi:hypothetical protein
MDDDSVGSHLNGLDEKINTRGYFERILAERDKRDAERDRRLDERFESQEKAVSAALAAAEKAVNAALLAAEKAVTKAEISQQRVNEGQNEFRGTLKDQAADLMPRAETELLVKELRAQLDDLRSRLDVGPLGLRALQSHSDTAEGRRQGEDRSADVIARALPILISTVAIIVTIILATR